MTARRIILSGAYGHGNLGDDLVAIVLADYLRKTGAEVLVSGGQIGKLAPDLTQHRSRLFRCFSRRSHLLLGGGGLLNDRWDHSYSLYFSSLAAMARMRGTSVSTAGIGIEPPRTLWGRECARVVGLLAKPLGVRDRVSMGIAQKLRARRPILGVDIGWLARSADLIPRRIDGRPRSGAATVAVTIAGEAVAAAQHRISLLSRVLSSLQAELGRINVRLVAMQENSNPLHDDASQLQEVIRAAGLRAVELVRPADAKAAAIVLGDSDLVLGYRLHALLLATMADVPVVAVSRAAKVEEALEGAPLATVLRESADWRDVLQACLASLTRRIIDGSENFHYLEERERLAVAHVAQAMP